jgi:hypothetical protein
MTNEELIAELALAGLRLASDDEAGWTYTYLTDEGERVTAWVTDLS